MHITIKNLSTIEQQIQSKIAHLNLKNYKPKIIAISKTFKMTHINHLINHGHLHFGENKVQEAEKKWMNTLEKNIDIKLHMVGKLQTNKAKKAVEIFHYVHSLDNQKLAETLNKAEINSNKKLNYFIQVNVGEEGQKSGLNPKHVNDFYQFCQKETNLNIIGLMTIPPNDDQEEKHFKLLSNLNSTLKLKDLSMGMSGDYKTALNFNASFLRIGSAIFGERVKK